MFVWWEDPTIGRVEWRYSCQEHGVLSEIPPGVILRQELCVNSWGIPLLVINVLLAMCIRTEMHTYIIQKSDVRCLYTVRSMYLTNLQD